MMRALNQRGFMAGALVLLALAASPARAANVTLIKNGTVLTITKGTIEHGDVLIRDGKIAAVGQNLPAPAGAKVIDATGQFVMPGIIDCHSHIAVAGDVNEGSVSVSSMVNLADVINPEDIDIYRDLAGGVTAANVLHGSANPIGGQTEVIKLALGKAREGPALPGRAAGHQVCLGRESQAREFHHARLPAPLPRLAHGSDGRLPRSLQPGPRLQEGLGRLRPPQGRRRIESDPAAARPETGTAGRGA